MAPDELPPLPPTATQAAGGAIGKLIWGYIERYLWRLVRPYLPANVIKQIERAMTRFMDNLIWGCVFSVFFFAVFSCAIVGTLLLVVYAVVSSR